MPPAGGEPPRLEAYLTEVAEPARAVLLRELLRVEAHHRRRAGDEPRGDDYRGRLPDLDPDWLATVLTPDEPERAPQRPTEIRPRHAAIGNPPVPGYEVLGVLGSGGMGVVYQARQLKLNRVVALKTIQGGLHIGLRALQRFQREAEAVAQLQHPNIVQIYEVGEHEGRPYLALEFVGGGSLDQHLGGTPQPAHVAAGLVQTLARAVHHAHERGVLHRDLKPANVLLASPSSPLSPEERGGESSHPPLAACVPKITDFGLAKLLDDDAAGPTHSGDVLGTPSYMAPEQTEGKPGTTSPATDVYGLGTLLYELLTGRPPFKAETALETLLQVRSEEPVSPAGYRDGTATVWDVKEWRPTSVNGHAGPVLGVALAPGHRLVTASADETVRLWDAASGQELHSLRGHAGPVRGVALDPSGRYLVSGGADGMVKVWDVAAGIERLTLRGHRRGVRGVAFHPSGRYLASAGGMDNAVKVWDTGRAQEARVLRVSGEVATGVVFGSDGRLAACSRDGFVRVWDSRTGADIRTLRGSPGFGLTGVAYRPDGRHLAAGSLDGTVLVWDAEGRRALSLRGEGGPVRRVAYSPDGRLLAGVTDDGRLRLWDADTGRPARTIEGLLDGPVACVAFSPDGRLLASAPDDGTVRLWDLQAGRPDRDLRGHAKVVTGVAFSPDGRLLVSASADRKVKVWEVAPGRCLHTLEGHTGEVHAVAFSPDGSRLAAARSDPAVMVWDVVTGQPTLRLRGHVQGAYAVAFSPDGRLLVSASGDGRLRLWEAAGP
jgi:WD40 repeat protein